MPDTRDDKTCRVCGRRFSWRKRWAADWDRVAHCSSACRKRGLRPRDRQLEVAILELLEARGAGKTICPSEAARRVAPEGWRALMEPARQAARRLCARDLLWITQKGQIVDPSTAKGPIRLRLRPAAPAPQ